MHKRSSAAELRRERLTTRAAAGNGGRRAGRSRVLVLLATLLSVACSRASQTSAMSRVDSDPVA